MDYGKILARAFEITRKYRALWLFGILAALFSGGNSFNVGNWVGGGGNGGGGGDGSDVFPILPTGFWEMFSIIILVALCVFLILFLLSIALRFISRAALIRSRR